MISIRFFINGFDYYVDDPYFGRFDGKQNIEKSSPNYYIFSKTQIDSRGLKDIQIRNNKIQFNGDII